MIPGLRGAAKVKSDDPKRRRAQGKADEALELTVAEQEPSDEDIARALAEEQPTTPAPEQTKHPVRQRGAGHGKHPKG